MRNNRSTINPLKNGAHLHMLPSATLPLRPHFTDNHAYGIVYTYDPSRLLSASCVFCSRTEIFISVGDPKHSLFGNRTEPNQTTPHQACAYITNHSEAEVVVVENEAQLSKFVSQAPTLKSVKAIVMYRGEVPADLKVNFDVYTWDQFMEVCARSTYLVGL